MKSKHLYIFSERSFMLGSEPKEEDLELVRAGHIQIVNVENLTLYNGTDWEELKTLESLFP